MLRVLQESVRKAARRASRKVS